MEHSVLCMYVCFTVCLSVLPQNGLLYGVELARDHMSTKNGGSGGHIINVASMAGEYCSSRGDWSLHTGHLLGANN